MNRRFLLKIIRSMALPLPTCDRTAVGGSVSLEVGKTSEL